MDIQSTQLLIVMIIYLSFIIFFGIYKGRQVKTSSDYAIAGRKLPGWVAALSERSTGESSWALLGLPGAAYATGLMEVWTAIGCVAGVIIAWIFLAGRLRREAEYYKVNCFTDYIAQKHGEAGKWIRIVGSASIVFFFFFYVGAQFLGGGKTLEDLFGINRVAGMIIVVLMVVPYTIYGGFLSVTYTDVVQAIIMIVTLIIAPIAGIIYIANQPDGSLFASSMSEALQKSGESYSTWLGGASLEAKPELKGFLATIFPDSVNLVKGLGAGIIIAGAFSWFFGYLGGQPQLSMRFMAISDDKQAKQGRNIGVVWTLIAYVGALMIGWIGIAIFGPSGLKDPETVMPQVLTTLFNPWIAGILITGVLAAIISTANSLLILSATELSESLIKPFRNKEAKNALKQSRIITALLSAMALLVAYLAHTFKSDSIYVLVSYVWAGIGGTFAIVILLTLFWRKYHGKAALITIITGIGFTIFWIASGNAAVVTARLVSFVVTLLVAILSTYLVKSKS